MKVSMGRFDGGETVLFIKPDSALELSGIAYKLGIKLGEIDPDTGPKKPNRRLKEPRAKSGIKEQTCYYCKKSYQVRHLRSKVWRNFCKTPRCISAYQADYREYTKNPVAYRRREQINAQRRQLASNLAEETGLKVTLENR